ncbi:MAG: UDP-N-acetylmuramate dehydrogenase [Dysgonamonadaceae bacterium]|jgi:UDP-N-acetylmuramate dehydrogenase|nr:UDP-N-acetylmuramate dehydrogenase [Dysgonamonadaceae bacterium]
MRIIENYSLLKHNTFHLDVKTRWFVEYESEADLQRLLGDEYFMSQTFLHIGQGSNLLFLGNFNGVIVHSGIRGIDIWKENDGHVWLKAGASEDWDAFVRFCVEKGWGGVENLSLIPGEVGASAFQNIGAYGVEASDCIEEVHTYHIPTGEKRIFTNAECKYSYRHSFFKEEANCGLYFITHVIYRLSKQPEYILGYGNVKSRLEGMEINLQTIREAIISIRREKLPDPAVEGNAGSFFMNPYICIAHYGALKKQYPAMPHYPVDDKVVKIPAAWLIEQCGLKGKTLGGAAVSTKQPLVIVNQNHATGTDIALLAEAVRRSVQENFGIELRPEVYSVA